MPTIAPAVVFPKAADVECAGDLGRRVRVRTARREIHEPDPVSASSDLAAGELRGEPGLADAAGTSQRHKPRPAEGFTDALKLARPADQRRQRYGHIVHSGTLNPGRSRAGRRHHRIDHHTLTRRGAMLWPGQVRCSALSLPRPHPCRLSGISILVEISAQGLMSADLETGDLGRIGNWRWQRTWWSGVRHCLLGSVGVVEPLVLTK